MIHPIDNYRTYDGNGVMMPWYTRPCLEWLDKLTLTSKSVFEFGCGASSLWYKSRCGLGSVNGVDSNYDWCFLSGQTGTEDKQVYLSLINTYAQTNLKNRKRAYASEPDIVDSITFAYDLIIIDGDFRDDCTEHALKHLKKGGYLIADNFEQASADLAHWPKTRELTKNMPVTFYKEPGHPDWVTAVFQNV